MPTNGIRMTFIFIWIFIQVLWMITTRGANITNFLRTFINVRSTSIVLFEIICFFQVLLPINTSIALGFGSNLLELFGIILAIASTALASWSKLIMGRSWGRPAQHDKKVQLKLVMSGPFAFSRNPLYLGLLLLFIGQQIALRSYLLLLAPLFFLAIRNAVLTEEKLLLQHFWQSLPRLSTKSPSIFIKSWYSIGLTT